MKKYGFTLRVAAFTLMLLLLYGSVLMGSKAVISASVPKVAERDFPLIIIDAGHGGFDGGAVARDGTPEKDINLSISLKLNDYLKALGFETLLTRNEDTALNSDSAASIREKKTSDLHNRMLLTQDNENSVLISIHQNHFTVEKYNGTQVFYSPNDELSPILAEYVQKNVVNSLQPENTRLIKKCGSSVYLIYKAVRPSILVECGFLSNREEAEKLKTDEYQSKMAFAVAEGILNCLLNET